VPPASQGERTQEDQKEATVKSKNYAISVCIVKKAVNSS
ncbi:hypothetical protein L195_g063142, partial [Trifolium pratense]